MSEDNWIGDPGQPVYMGDVERMEEITFLPAAPYVGIPENDRQPAYASPNAIWQTGAKEMKSGFKKLLTYIPALLFLSGVVYAFWISVTVGFVATITYLTIATIIRHIVRRRRRR